MPPFTDRCVGNIMFSGCPSVIACFLACVRPAEPKKVFHVAKALPRPPSLHERAASRQGKEKGGKERDGKRKGKGKGERMERGRRGRGGNRGTSATSNFLGPAVQAYVLLARYLTILQTS